MAVGNRRAEDGDVPNIVANHLRRGRDVCEGEVATASGAPSAMVRGPSAKRAAAIGR